MKDKDFCKHLIECKCVLLQFRKMPNPPLHKFIVFSELNSSGLVIPSLAQCNNCGAVHKIQEIGVSTITKKEDATSVLTIDEIKSSLPEKLLNDLSRYELEQHQWLEIKWVYENEDWGRVVVLTKETSDGLIAGKYVQIIGTGLWKFGSFSKEDNQNIAEK